MAACYISTVLILIFLSCSFLSILDQVLNIIINQSGENWVSVLIGPAFNGFLSIAFVILFLHRCPDQSKESSFYS